MRPIKFAQMSGTLTRPPSMTEEECSPLPVYYAPNHDSIISCWKPTFAERIAMLLGARVWLWVFGSRHPPVDISVRNPFDDR